jgi:site-specific DNA recombinase
MGHSYTSKGNKRYRYYVCLQAQKRGWESCPTKSVPAGEIESFVVEQIKGIGADPMLLHRTLNQLQRQGEESLLALQKEEKGIGRQLTGYHSEISKLAGQSGIADRLADVQGRITVAERRLAEVRREIDSLSATAVDEEEAAEALRQFTPLWESLSPREQARVLQLLIERVDYDGGDGNIAIIFRPDGIGAITEQLDEVAA